MDSSSSGDEEEADEIATKIEQIQSGKIPCPECNKVRIPKIQFFSFCLDHD